MSDKSDIAVETLKSGCNCAQSVLTAVCNRASMRRGTALAVTGAMGGGLGNSGHTCGAVTGGVMAIGLSCPFVDPADKAMKSEAIRVTKEFMTRFEALNGSVVCRELLGCDLSQPGELERARAEGRFSTTCVKCVRDAVEILEELLPGK